MMYANEFIGLVLCGGRSTRMGRDKGLIKSGKITWAEQQYQKLSSLNIPTYVSINENQRVAYQKIFPPLQLITDHPFSDINGPLRGLLSAHCAYPEKHILCMPCDMPDVSKKFLSELMAVFTQNYPVNQLFIPLVDWQLQPLCGLYAKESLYYFSNQYEAGTFAHKSMIDIIDDYSDTMVMLVEDQDESEFENYNAPEDLK